MYDCLAENWVSGTQSYMNILDQKYIIDQKKITAYLIVTLVLEKSGPYVPKPSFLN